MSYNIAVYQAYEDTQTFNSKALISDLVFSDSILRINATDSLTESDISTNPDDITASKIISILNNNGYNVSFDKHNSRHESFYYSIYSSCCAQKSLNISGLIDYISSNIVNIPLNIQKMIKIKEKIKEVSTDDIHSAVKNIYQEFKKENSKFLLGLPPSLLVIGEGITEETLLPVFSDKQGVNFKQNGIQIIGAGGKNQVARLYYEIKDKLNIPVLILLDADAQEIASKIEPVLKDKDKLYLIKEGEFEDILPLNLICRSVNSFYKMLGSISQEEIQTQSAMSNALSDLWKEKGFGEFKKAEFANLISQNIQEKTDISATLSEIIQQVKELSKF